MSRAPAHPWRRVGVFAAIVVLIAAANVALGTGALADGEAAIAAVRSLVDENLLAALGVYLAFTAVGAVLLALPGIVFALVAGVCFGPVVGTLACAVSATAGAVLAFLAGRYFLRDAVRTWADRRPALATWLFSGSQANAVVMLAVTRLVPLLPFNVQNFAYGATDVRLGTYTVCTLVFMLPGTALYTCAAAGVVDAGVRVACWAVAFALLAVTLAAAWALRRRYLEKGEGDAEG